MAVFCLSDWLVLVSAGVNWDREWLPSWAEWLGSVTERHPDSVMIGVVVFVLAAFSNKGSTLSWRVHDFKWW